MEWGQCAGVSLRQFLTCFCVCCLWSCCFPVLSSLRRRVRSSRAAPPSPLLHLFLILSLIALPYVLLSFSPITCPCSRAGTLLAAFLLGVKVFSLVMHVIFLYWNCGLSIPSSWRAPSLRRRASTNNPWRKNRRRSKTWRAT